MIVNLAILVSDRGSNLKAIINAIKLKYITNAKIKIVISNNSNAKALETAHENNIKTQFIAFDKKMSVEEYDKKIIQVLNSHGIVSDNCLILLAGYTKILSSTFCKKFKWKIMNIHPSLLPSFKGLHAQKQALEFGAKVTGATVHFVVPELDSGPLILQESVKILSRDTVSTLSKKILHKEHQIYPKAVKLFIENKLEIKNNQVNILS